MYSWFLHNPPPLLPWLTVGLTISIPPQTKYTQCKYNRPWDISRCIKPCLNISNFDIIAIVCCRFYIVGLLGWCWISKHICSRGFIEFIILDSYATAKSWLAHQKVRLDELVWKGWVSEIFMETFVELSIKPFENILVCQLLFCWSIIIICFIASGKQTPPPPPTASDKLCPCPHRIQRGRVISECGVAFFIRFLSKYAHLISKHIQSVTPKRKNK